MTRRLRRSLAARLVLHALLCALAFLGVARAVALRAGLPEMRDLSDKLKHLETSGRSYDLLLVGSSRIRHGLDPRQLGAALAGRGVSLRSFNFGVLGMEPQLANASLRRLTRPARPNWKWAVVEVGRWDPALPPSRRLQRRSLFWHDFPETVSALRSTLASSRSPLDKLNMLGGHSLSFLARSSAAGRGVEGLGLEREADAEIDRGALVSDGFEALPNADEDPGIRRPIRRSFLSEVDAYRAEVERRAAGAGGSRRTHRELAAERAAWAGQIALLRAAGIEPIYLVPPTLEDVADTVALLRESFDVAVLSFDDPAVHPELYALDHRFDAEHLTASGAEIFTSLLARRLIDRLARSGTRSL